MEGWRYSCGCTVAVEAEVICTVMRKTSLKDKNIILDQRDDFVQPCFYPCRRVQRADFDELK